MVDMLYYRNIIGTQNDPEILKLEMHDLLNDLEEERKENIPLDKPVKPANGVDMDNCFYCGHRASELTQIRVAIKPPNTPNRWKVIGVACNACNDKFISQIDANRLSV